MAAVQNFYTGSVFRVTFLATILHVVRFHSFQKRCEASFSPLTAQGVHVLVFTGHFSAQIKLTEFVS